jgi:hypothetical protein
VAADLHRQTIGQALGRGRRLELVEFKTILEGNFSDAEHFYYDLPVKRVAFFAPFECLGNVDHRKHTCSPTFSSLTKNPAIFRE